MTPRLAPCAFAFLPAGAASGRGVRAWVPVQQPVPAALEGRGPFRGLATMGDSSQVTLTRPLVSGDSHVRPLGDHGDGGVRELRIPLAHVRRVEHRRVHVPVTIVATTPVYGAPAHLPLLGVFHLTGGRYGR